MQDELWVPDSGDRSKFSQSIVWAVYFRRQGFVTGGRGMPHRKRITFWPLSLQWLEPISCTDGPSFLITSSLTGWSSLTKVKTISFQLPQLHGRETWNEAALSFYLLAFHQSLWLPSCGHFPAFYWRIIFVSKAGSQGCVWRPCISKHHQLLVQSPQASNLVDQPRVGIPCAPVQAGDECNCRKAVFSSTPCAVGGYLV